MLTGILHTSVNFTFQHTTLNFLVSENLKTFPCFFDRRSLGMFEAVDVRFCCFMLRPNKKMCVSGNILLKIGVGR